MNEVTAVERMARVADLLAGRSSSPRAFLRAFAWNCARIRPGLLGYRDLATGGGNRFPGSGFKSEFDDGTRGQVRHFAGIAVAPVLIGDRLAAWASRAVLRDADHSADGRLSRAALEFSRGIRDGAIALDDSGDWIRANIAE